MNNVKDFGAVGNGSTDDTFAIRDAIAFTKAEGGGQIYFPAGVYKVTDTITIDSPVGVVGAGSNCLSIEENGTYSNVTTVIAWYGTNKVLFDYVGRIDGVVFSNIALDGRNTGTIAIRLDRVRNSYFQSIQIHRFREFGVDLNPIPQAGVTNDNCMFNNFQSLVIWAAQIEGASCLRLDGNALDKNNINAGAGNSCHNTFTNTQLWTVMKNYNLQLLDCDNNSFYMLYCFRIDYDTKHIYFGYNPDIYNESYIPGHGCARSNYFYHCQGSIFASAGPTKTAPTLKNYVYGYDRENGQKLPVTINNAKVVLVLLDTAINTL